MGMPGAVFKTVAIISSCGAKLGRRCTIRLAQFYQKRSSAGVATQKRDAATVKIRTIAANLRYSAHTA